jgi:hypothetical protein
MGTNGLVVRRSVVGYWTTDFTNGHGWFLGREGLVVWGAGIGMGDELEWCRASRLAPGKRQQASAFQGLRLAGWENGEYGASRSRASWEGWRAHSVREREL